MCHNVMRCTQILIYNIRDVPTDHLLSLSLSLSLCVCVCNICARTRAYVCDFFLRDDSDDAYDKIYHPPNSATLLRKLSFSSRSERMTSSCCREKRTIFSHIRSTSDAPMPPELL